MYLQFLNKIMKILPPGFSGEIDGGAAPGNGAAEINE